MIDKRESTRSELAIMDPATLLTPAEAATLLGVTALTLAKWRLPDSTVELPFVKLSHRVVRYRLGSVQAFLDQREHLPMGRRVRSGAMTAAPLAAAAPGVPR